MNKEIYIFGASGYAREILYIINQMNEFTFKAFVDKDDKLQKVNVDDNVFPVISEDAFESICESAKHEINAVIGLADTGIASIIIKKFRNLCYFPNIIHPDVEIYGKLDIGIGNTIASKSVISLNVKIGSFNRINTAVLIGHDAQIGNNNQINPSCSISGNVMIGNNNFIGVNSVLLQNVSLKDNIVIGASSLVIRKIEKPGTYFGIPVKKLDY